VTPKKKRPVVHALVSPCCRRDVKAFGVADAYGAVHWCPCGMAWKMRDLVRKH
jgi:hypothetical protein